MNFWLFLLFYLQFLNFRHWLIRLSFRAKTSCWWAFRVHITKIDEFFIYPFNIFFALILDLLETFWKEFLKLFLCVLLLYKLLISLFFSAKLLVCHFTISLLLRSFTASVQFLHYGRLTWNERRRIRAPALKCFWSVSRSIHVRYKFIFSLNR